MTDILTQAVLNIKNEIVIPRDYQIPKKRILTYLRLSRSHSVGDFLLDDEFHYLNVRNHNDIKYFLRFAKNSGVKKAIDEFYENHVEITPSVTFQVLAKAIRSREHWTGKDVEIEIRIQPNNFQIKKILEITKGRRVKYLIYNGLNSELLNKDQVVLEAGSTDEEIRGYLSKYSPI